MIESSLPNAHTNLREGLSGSGGSEFGGETEGLVDWEISFDHEHGSARNLSLFKNVTTFFI